MAKVEGFSGLEIAEIAGGFGEPVSVASVSIIQVRLFSGTHVEVRSSQALTPEGVDELIEHIEAHGRALRRQSSPQSVR